jgi:hypothetical protein
MRWLKIIAVLIILFAAIQHIRHRALHHPDGAITVASDPEQTDTSDPAFTLKQFQVQPLKAFHITARVLSTESYTMDAGADVSPLDLALGWGAMSDSAVIDQLDISQSGRFYRYHWADQPPIPASEIISHSANMHMIPADPAIAQQLKAIRVGQIVHLSGDLVEVTDPQKGWHWRSSLTREDTGDGACELIWVKQVSVSDR